jgi:predicted Ser/Thr protein kinase
MYKTVWRLDVKKLGGLANIEKTLKITELDDDLNGQACYNVPVDTSKKIIDISCPSNDHPILQIPKEFREKFLDELITDKKFKKKLFNSKEYRWVLKDNPCSICSSVYRMLLEKLDEPIDIYNMLSARKMLFDKQFGRGISVFNPGDEHTKRPVTDVTLQNLISNLFKKDEIKYIYSQLANTNNGIYALMDIKDNNIQRLIDLHGIISDGIHKVEFSEERIKSLFVGLVNPEDKKHYEDVKSFQDRIVNISIPYVLDYAIEVSIYKNKFGNEIEQKFLPGVLDNFAKIIISSRLRFDSATIKKWIRNIEKYSKYLDDNNLLLKMELYKGIIPEWLSEEDVKNFNKQIRKDLITESETEGLKGFSGRQSLSVFNNFFMKHADSDKLITMNMIKDFFAENEKYLNQVPVSFIESLEDMYDYNVLQEVKEAIYFYSEKQITKDILNYLFAINYDLGAIEKSSYTGDTITITEDYLKNFEALFLGTLSSPEERAAFRKDIHNEYITHTIAYEMKLENKEITKTKLFGILFEKYTRSLKENALAPYADNDNFRRVLLDYGAPDFNKYDEVSKRTVTRLLANLKTKFEYSLEGAKQVCLYVIDKKLNKEY